MRGAGRLRRGSSPSASTPSAPVGDYKNLTYRVEDVHLRLIDEEGLEEDGDDGSALTEHQEGAVDPCAGLVEEVQEGDLRQVGPDEEVRKHEDRQQEARQQTAFQQRP